MTDKEIKETITYPQHYRPDAVYETIKVIEAWELDYHLGNAVKYISRAGNKESFESDIRKAIWYLERRLNYAK